MVLLDLQNGSFPTIYIVTAAYFLTIPLSRAASFAVDFFESSTDMTSQSIHNVVVLGAGGSLGPKVLGALKPHFAVTITTRKPSTSTFPPKFKLNIIADDYPTAELLQAFKGQDAVVSLITPWACQVQ
jgi:hypothetical protein